MNLLRRLTATIFRQKLVWLGLEGQSKGQCRVAWAGLPPPAGRPTPGPVLGAASLPHLQWSPGCGWSGSAWDLGARTVLPDSSEWVFGRSRERRPAGSACEPLPKLLACDSVCSGEWPGAWGGCPFTCTGNLMSSWELLKSESVPPELLMPPKGRELHSTLLIRRSMCCLHSSEPHLSGGWAGGSSGDSQGPGCLWAAICSLAAWLHSWTPALPPSSLHKAGRAPQLVVCRTRPGNRAHGRTQDSPGVLPCIPVL